LLLVLCFPPTLSAADFASAGAAPRVLKRTLQTALVWTLYEELLPQLSAVYHLAVAQQGAMQEASSGSSRN
jgi:solute carrier family 25 protein 38